GRTSWARLVLGTIGIGMAAAVLLIAASINHILANESARNSATVADDQPVAGVAPLYYVNSGTQFRDTRIDGIYVQATGKNSPVPPGLSRVPGPDEVVLSPALQRLLASPDGALLRPRFPQRVIGLIGQAGLAGPQDLIYYAGIPAGELTADMTMNPVYSFGEPPDSTPVDPAIEALLATGVVALLIPILIMVSVSSRIAGAARDRRLAALRLVGAGTRQVRRIAAAEALVPAAAGLVLGGLLFLVFRQIMPHVELFGESVFASDVVPPLPLVVLTVVLVPVLAVGTSLFALRRTVIEPLGVVRDGRPVRRRLWWRVVLVALGVGLLLLAQRMPTDRTLWVGTVVAGAAALLVGVPVLLPYLLERGVSRLRGGAVSWQLAMRRLQLDSGTPARVVGGVAVVLAGAIALATVLAATSQRVALPDEPDVTPGAYYVVADAAIGPRVADAVRGTGLVHGYYPITQLEVTTGAGNAQDGTDLNSIMIASCGAITQFLPGLVCHDGDVFSESGGYSQLPPGTRLTVVRPSDTNAASDTYGSWTVPAHVRPLPSAGRGIGPGGALVVTPGAIAGVRIPAADETFTLVHLDPNRPDDVERMRNALAAYPLRTQLNPVDPAAELNTDQKTLVTVRNGLLIGSLFTLGLAGISLLVLALEQVRERRRPLAMLAASGVPRAVLSRSLLWQIAVPVAIGVVAAVVTGIGLALLVLRVTSTSVVLDWADVGIFSGAAVVLVLLVTAATLPALRSAMRLSSLRTE
ncbi:MAG TPA: FtsX-like permease family protein, partial [Pseudonocardiaceae bacterium]|nr:FtsX-like permease family protein [Pseudonocardiaceae bacterium]